MRTMFALTIGFLLSAGHANATIVASSHSADLSLATTSHKLVDAEYIIIPTKTEMRKIPNCRPNAESGETCIREIVLESKPMIQANVSYIDPNAQSDGHEKSWLKIRFDLTDFDQGEVELLKAVYPRWKFPNTNAPRAFVARNLDMTVAKETRTIQVIDVGRSKLCRIMEDGSPERNCKERIVYKDALTKVKEVTVRIK